MIQIDSEDLLTLSAAAKWLCSRGKQVGRTSLWRWAGKTGYHGIRLETISLAGTRHTSVQALQRFFEAVTKAASA